MIFDIFLQFFLGEKNEVVFSGVQLHFRRLFQQLRVKLDGCDAVGVLAVPVRFGPSVFGQLHIGMFEDVVLEVLDRPFPANKKERLLGGEHTID